MENLEFLLTNLINKLGTLFMFAFIISKSTTVRELINKKAIKLKDKFKLSIIFGFFGIIGTYLSIEFNGALINTRIIGVATGGILGGPLVGFLSGIIAGTHRYFMPTGLFTKVACAVSVPLEGLIAGLLSKRVMKKKNIWFYAAGVGAIGESMRKISVLIFSKPYTKALDLVRDIWLPMVIINSIGLALLFLIIQNIFKDREKIGAKQFNLSINIVDQVLPYLQNRLDSSNLFEISSIIKNKTTFDAITITNKKEIIAYSSCDKEKFKIGEKIKSPLIKQVLESGQIFYLDEEENRDIKIKQNVFNSIIIAPLKDAKKIIGTMNFYKLSEKAMTEIDKEIAWSLSKLISNQLRIKRLEENSKLLVQAELRSLQAQINPHFLFNSLSVIASLCRINSKKARNLILHLSNHFRNNLDNDKKLISLDTELDHVKSYIEIEKARFEGKLVVINNIDEDIECLVPPLTLQPIVENSIKHGILNKENGGKVIIEGEKKSQNIIISIYDNGIGISEKKIDSIINKDIKHKNSIGLYNVNKRLIGIYGEEYKLKIKSKIGEWTQVDVKIPIIETIN
ncbi:MAG: LytS/YhcK type 5TM receptor domain-containing protein [Bacillota bacterium]